MRYYFVRHAESNFNAVGRYQQHHVDLSDLGKKQTELLAHRFRNISAGIILSSPYTRTRRTAEAIKKVVNKEIIYSPLLREWQDPSEMAGRLYADPLASSIHRLLSKHRADKNWHFSDEENIHDLIVRAQTFLDFISIFVKQQNVVIVSHNAVIKAIVCAMVFGKTLTPQIFFHYDSSFEMDNTGVTVCEKTKQDQNWKVLSWNDSLHLKT